MLKYLSEVLYILSGSRKNLILLLLGFVISSFLEAIGIGLLAPFMKLASNPDISEFPPFWRRFFNQLNVGNESNLIVILGLIIIAFFLS